MFSWRSVKENGELTERFPILENRRFTQDLSGIHRLGKLTVNDGFLAVVAGTSPIKCADLYENGYICIDLSYTTYKRKSLKTLIY